MRREDYASKERGRKRTPLQAIASAATAAAAAALATWGVACLRQLKTQQWPSIAKRAKNG